MFLSGDAQRLQERKIAMGEGAVADSLGLAVFRLGIRFDLIQSNGGFKHQQDIEALLTNLTHHASNLFTFADGFVNRLAKLLNEILHLLIQRHPQFTLQADLPRWPAESPCGPERKPSGGGLAKSATGSFLRLRPQEARRKTPKVEEGARNEAVYTRVW